MLREYFRCNRESFYKAVDLSIIVKRNAADLKAKEVEQELHFLKKMG